MTDFTTTLYIQDGKWHVNVYWPATKRRLRKCLGTDNEAAAKKRCTHYIAHELPKIDSDKLAAAAAGKEPTRLRDLARWYLDTHLAVTGAKPRTIDKYTSNVNDCTEYLRDKGIHIVGDVRLRHLQEWVQSTKAKVPGQKLGIIRGWFLAAERAGEIDASPVKFWSIPERRRIHNGPHALSWADVLRALDLLLERKATMWNICRFMAHTGVAISDAMDLRWGEVNTRERRMKRARTKTGEPIDVPLNDAAMAAIQHERARLDENLFSSASPVVDARLCEHHDGRHSPKPTAQVFTNSFGKPWTYDAVKDGMDRIFADADFPISVTPHVFRHSFATKLADAGCPPTALKELLAHGNIKTTLIYYHDVSFEQKRRWTTTLENP